MRTMKYCVYAGALYKVTSESGSMVYLQGFYGNEAAGKDKVTEIPEEVYLQVKDEYEAAVKEVISVTQRIHRLNEEYHKKHSALQDLRTDAGRREKAAISSLIINIKHID